MNYISYFSNASKKQTMPFLIKTRTELGDMKTIMNLASGLPNPEFFPLREATFSLKDGKVIHVPQDLINVALQYGSPAGMPQLVDQLMTMTAELLAPPHMDGRKVLVTAGANVASYIIAQTFIDPGDYAFIPEMAYPHIHHVFKDAEARIVPVPSDDGGIRPDMLREALEKSSDGRRKLMYIVPHGDNPTGITMSENRMRELYSLACEYDFLIMEDDPYYFLQYDPQVSSSFLSLDTEGRVLRVDTFSKTIGAGVRLGYITADQPFVDKLTTMHSFIMTHASPFSQVFVSELLRCLGHEGFIEMAKSNAKKYKQLRDVVLQAATKHLTGLCEWRVPNGMFLWLKVLGLKDVTETVNVCCSKGLLFVPGCQFMVDSTQPCPYIRMSFSLITPESVDKVFQILADVIREELKRTTSGN
ncbi:kynurenine/alpha-aminoadipate aminotransferase, mitochondrial-like isoform X1 [Scylla paramamosain]|uniref:kynurenine/alpha-aminoadipate aminotransferase, mitochondrial-like isoform X1 n=1 Tax=Scylla paramamosain TaxID=85552 RepID=UPI003083DB84